MLLGLAISTLDNLTALPDYKSYMREGAHWIAANVPAETTVTSDDYIIDYYAHRPHGEKIVAVDKLARALSSTQPPFYVAAKVKSNNEASIRALIDDPPVVEFQSNRAVEALLVFEVAERSDVVVSP